MQRGVMQKNALRPRLKERLELDGAHDVRVIALGVASACALPEGHR
jgi:hypothetical protein